MAFELWDDFLTFCMDMLSLLVAFSPLSVDSCCHQCHVEGHIDVWGPG